MNTGFVVYNRQTGIIVSSGVCARTVLELNAEEGCDVLAHDLASINKNHMVIRGAIVEGYPVLPELPKPFDLMRARAYPPISDFADALYWQNKGDNTKMLAYLAACDAVKLQYPKPQI